jgi:plastocyanin
MRTTVTSAIAAVVALGLALAGGARPCSASAVVVHDTTVKFQGFGFRPPTQEVRAGTRVTWLNQDDIEHTVTSANPERHDEEQIYLAAGATDAALGGRNAEFKAAAAALDSNSVDLSRAIGSAYDSDLALRAAGHMKMIADPLADAIVKQFPQKFGS